MIEANDSNNHKLEFSYDSLGRLITETQSGSLVNYDYDNNNNLTSINDVSYTYDNLNRITNIGYDSNNIATYNYTGLENTSIVYANNTSIIKGYDNLSRINSLNNGVNTYNYTYDDVNNITSDSIKNYLYDDIYRLKNVNETNSGTLLESFNYDNVGNRTNNFNSKTGSGANYDYETNILNQYTSLSGSTLSGSLNYTYDDNGNIKSDGEKIFSYDYKNRLTKVETSSGIIAQYSYDVLNRRYLKETENEKVEYIYSNENILQEIATDETTNITTTKNYINGITTDDLIAYEENNDIYYYHKNHLGSVEGISDNMGNIVVSYDYDSFGNFEITSGTDNGNTRLYTGREYDSEIGLYYLRARYYNPLIGRFISRDPIDIADDVNLYAYVGNNSLNYVDLTGTEGKLLVDIENGNKFVVELVSRNLNSEYVGWVGIHSFIVIHSYGENGKNTYTIGGHNNEVTGMLDGEFNSSKDFISSNGYFGKGAFKGSIFLETPEGMSDAQFVRNIYDEYKDYNEDKKNYDKFGNEDGFKNVGNCNNFSTTLLYNASSNDSGIVSSISSFNPAGYNPGIGKQFHGSYYKSERKQINSCSE